MAGSLHRIKVVSTGRWADALLIRGGCPPGSGTRLSIARTVSPNEKGRPSLAAPGFVSNAVVEITQRLAATR